MTADLTTSFKDRMRKRLYEPIDVVAPLAKMSRPDKVREEPVMEVPSAPVPFPDITGFSSVLPAASPVREKICPTQDGAQAYPALAAKDLNQKNAPLRRPS